VKHVYRSREKKRDFAGRLTGKQIRSLSPRAVSDIIWNLPQRARDGLTESQLGSVQRSDLVYAVRLLSPSRLPRSFSPAFLSRMGDDVRHLPPRHIQALSKAQIGALLPQIRDPAAKRYFVQSLSARQRSESGL